MVHLRLLATLLGERVQICNRPIGDVQRGESFTGPSLE
jgi:hypothetical protein